MKKLFIISTLLLSTYAQADLFDSLTGNLNLSPTQSGNLRSGLASILGGSKRGNVTIAQTRSFSTCFEMLIKAKAKQLDADAEFVKVGFATNRFYSNVIEGDYQQFHNRDKNRSMFGRTLMRGISDIESIGFNSTTSRESAPHLDSDCSSYMDIEKVSKVQVDGRECRKVDLVLNAEDPKTKKDYKAYASNLFCEGENIVKTDFTGREFREIYEMHEILD